jgi:ribosomal-protein-alanine N-acetyltransferase
MRSEDVDVVARLEQQVFPDPWPPSAFEELLETQGWVSLVAEHREAVIGYAIYQIILDEAHLTNIAVHPDHRRKSVAKHLLDHILEAVKLKKCRVIFLEVRPSNAEARAFYQKHGFKELYRRPRYYRRPVEDALVLIRSLDGTKPAP